MKALILAAGYGQRMRPLTDHVPKPLLGIGGQALIDYHIGQLAEAGIREIAINVAHLGDKILSHCGDGSRYGVHLHYSNEGTPLETGGAIKRLLHWLGASPFILLNGDVFCPGAVAALMQHSLPEGKLGHLQMVDNPTFHPAGDFAIDAQGSLSMEGDKLTYSGTAWLDPACIAEYPAQRDCFGLGEVFRHWIAAQRLQGSHYQGEWSDVGTPERLLTLARKLADARHT